MSVMRYEKQSAIFEQTVLFWHQQHKRRDMRRLVGIFTGLFAKTDADHAKGHHPTPATESKDVNSLWIFTIRTDCTNHAKSPGILAN